MRRAFILSLGLALVVLAAGCGEGTGGGGGIDNTETGTSSGADYELFASEFSFAPPFLVIEKAGTVIATDGDKVWRTPYDACVLVMPSTAHVKPGNTMVRLGRYDS